MHSNSPRRELPFDPVHHPQVDYDSIIRLLVDSRFKNKSVTDPSLFDNFRDSIYRHHRDLYDKINGIRGLWDDARCHFEDNKLSDHLDHDIDHGGAFDPSDDCMDDEASGEEEPHSSDNDFIDDTNCNGKRARSVSSSPEGRELFGDDDDGHDQVASPTSDDYREDLLYACPEALHRAYDAEQGPPPRCRKGVRNE